MFCYSENEVFAGSPVPYHAINANKSWLRHYGNELYLEFIEINGTFAERKQAAKELILCRRKKDRMEKHTNFDMSQVFPEIQRMNKEWKNGR